MISGLYYRVSLREKIRPGGTIRYSPLLQRRIEDWIYEEK
ncbi:hypothetical protein VU01_12332 [Candidatus Electrothrix marina]|uniref:Uncharacterized protein n=1 Tax=Candidatus Electrothrix marina TaxID=1859130 RepID=A0A3S3R540_9BACT|nr:hypothetical protein VU00_10137 [Candidatus Electrothrix marina]RWX50996.1 hypothetical protein VU01_12332 [Candidatus Electrothrix marina]